VQGSHQVSLQGLCLGKTTQIVCRQEPLREQQEVGPREYLEEELYRHSSPDHHWSFQG